MHIRQYRPGDCGAIAQLFYEAVHANPDYSQVQRAAWAPQVPENWHETFLAHHTVVAEEDDQIVGFGDMDGAGYLDRLYVHPAYQRKGVATAICAALEKGCTAPTLTTHASITAKPFFENRGYRAEKLQQVERKGVLLTNYIMVKQRIRRATWQDAGTLAQLACKLWPENSLLQMTVEMSELLTGTDGTCFLLTEGDASVGFAQCQLRHDYVEGTGTNPVGYLEGIFVEPEFRGRGLARVLLAACENWARESGCEEFASDCELTNAESLQFHLQMGFHEANRIICFTKKL